MAPRPAWKGYLKLSLVTCAVELSNATTQSEKVSFRILNRATGNTVKRQYIDSETGKPVDDKNEVKGYEIGKDEFLLIEEEEIEAVQIESSHTLSLDSFVEKSDDRADLSRHALLSDAGRQGLGGGLRGDPRGAGRARRWPGWRASCSTGASGRC